MKKQIFTVDIDGIVIQWSENPSDLYLIGNQKVVNVSQKQFKKLQRLGENCQVKISGNVLKITEV